MTATGNVTLSNDPALPWLRSMDSPWIQQQLLIHIDQKPLNHPEVVALAKKLWRHPLIRDEIAICNQWPNPVLKRHNTASHPLNRFGFLVDLGYTTAVRGSKQLTRKLLSSWDKQSHAFQSLIELPKAFGGSGKPEKCWMLCDAPVLTHALLGFGLGEDSRVIHSLEALLQQITPVGFSCASSFPKVRGPGRKADPCPITNLLCLKAFSLAPQYLNKPECKIATDMLLSHYEQRHQKKYRMFGIGTDFKKLKYPHIWYDILHVVEVLSRFPWTHTDKRFLEMADIIFAKASAEGRYKAESVWRPYKQFDFGQKREASAMITLAVLKIKNRLST